VGSGVFDDDVVVAVVGRGGVLSSATMMGSMTAAK
jgi:hypothetical protein